ncbi:MAG: right-handed parallel beta-helix repeat-containing protein, partial [Acidobacteriota bacterium]|nr:right-handed parallel beta-helix repeat-containing protein [Acidobacteriota bacterium]
AINRFPDYGVAIIGGGYATTYLDGLFVGTDVTGTLARPNGRGIGFFAPNASVNLDNNVISGNVHSGIFAASTWTVWLYNSLIGVGSDGRALGNGNSGVFLFRGGIDIGGCTIANNGQFGVSIEPEVARASMGYNRIYANGLQGIDWGLDGPSTGLAERRIPDPPTISDAVYDASKNETVITGMFDRASRLGALVYIDVFANTARNAVGRAEGEQFIDRFAPNGLTFTAHARGDLRGRIITTTLSVGPYLDGVPTLTSEFSEGVVAH